EEHDELFKWRAMKTWRGEWFKPEGSFSPFAERFAAAKKDFLVLTDTAIMHPSAGVLELCAYDPAETERLFREVLFADANGSASAAQDNMDAFLEGYEVLREKCCPRKWSYKQDRHSASVYLAMNEPDFHYIFKSSEARQMAKYIDFGLNIGTGADFSLENYYRMCGEILAVLKEHDSLLKKHFERLTDQCYEDRSLHLLVFDLIYCCYHYDYYRGLTVPSTGKVKKRGIPNGPTAEELAKKEAERIAKIESVEKEIEGLEQSCAGCEDISLIGVQVTSSADGIGTVTGQEINRITVRFVDKEKSFILDKMYKARPRFEDDDEIVEAFTAFAKAKKKIDKLRRDIEQLQK
ncbi:MAG: hypothetical protein K5771_07875, partial [Oscillospiraceae bacterium]|nr:hypothetical protein [Oscillospiraceae bacterium]